MQKIFRLPKFRFFDADLSFVCQLLYKYSILLYVARRVVFENRRWVVLCAIHTLYNVFCLFLCLCNLLLLAFVVCPNVFHGFFFTQSHDKWTQNKAIIRFCCNTISSICRFRLSVRFTYFTAIFTSTIKVRKHACVTL